MGWCFEDHARLITEAEPAKIREFASLIGKDVFRTQLERSIGRDQAAGFISLLEQRQPRKRGKRT
jgi:hypothetical protein